MRFLISVFHNSNKNYKKIVFHYSFIRMSILTERGSLGLKFISQSTLKPNDFEAERNTIRCFKWSDDGKQLVYCNNQESIVVRFPDWEVVTRVSKLSYHSNLE